MKAVCLFKYFLSIHSIARNLIFLTLCLTIARAMSIPFLAIFLNQQSTLTPSQIGLFLGSAILFATLVGCLSGVLSDILGKKRFLILSICLCIGALSGLAFFQKLIYIYISNLLFNIGHSLYALLSKALLSEYVPREKRLSIFSLNYIGINIGWAIGPLVGSYFIESDSHNVFIYSAVIFLAMGIYFIIYIRRLNTRNHKQRNQYSIYTIIKTTF